MKSPPVEITRNLPDLVLFKLSWVLLVVFKSAGVVPALGIIAWKIVAAGVHPDRFLAPVVLTFVAGVTMDSLLMYTGLFVFPGPVLPVWLVLLWLSFGLTMIRGFAFLWCLHPAWQAACGAMAGSLGYGAGIWLDAVDTGLHWGITVPLVGVLWAVFVPAVLAAAWSLRPRGQLS